MIPITIRLISLVLFSSAKLLGFPHSRTIFRNTIMSFLFDLQRKRLIYRAKPLSLHAESYKNEQDTETDGRKADAGHPDRSSRYDGAFVLHQQ